MPEDLKTRIDNLEQTLRHLESSGEINPEVIYAIELLLNLDNITADDSGAAVSGYTKSVNESGSGSYAVAKEWDGLIKIGGKYVGYYN